MSTPGLGAMLHYLSGGSRNPPEKYYGKKIAYASLADDTLTIKFDDNTTIRIWDDGQSCCEFRYMRSDDDPKTLVGGILQKIEAKKHKKGPGEYDTEHEIVFVEIGTDKGFITIANHNEHNGYYGGFGLTIDE